MTDSAGSGLDHVRHALEATCDALMALESIALALRDGDGEPGVPVRVSQAIASLRQAIGDLRLARGVDESAVGRGFVVATGIGRDPDRTRRLS
jgi:hypothetical protein